MEHHGFIALLIPVLIDAANTSAVGVKYSLSWVSGVSGIRPNLIRGTVLFKAMTLEICDLHTQFLCCSKTLGRAVHYFPVF